MFNSIVGAIHFIHKFPHRCEQLHTRKNNLRSILYVILNTTDKAARGEVTAI